MDAGASFDPKIRTKNKIIKRRTDYEQNNFYRTVREKRFQNAQKHVGDNECSRHCPAAF